MMIGRRYWMKTWLVALQSDDLFSFGVRTNSVQLTGSLKNTKSFWSCVYSTPKGSGSGILRLKYLHGCALSRQIRRYWNPVAVLTTIAFNIRASYSSCNAPMLQDRLQIFAMGHHQGLFFDVCVYAFCCFAGATGVQFSSRFRHAMELSPRFIMKM